MYPTKQSIRFPFRQLTRAVYLASEPFPYCVCGHCRQKHTVQCALCTLCTECAQWMWNSHLECVPLCKTTIHKFICGAVLLKITRSLSLFLSLSLSFISRIMHLIYTICTRTFDTYNYNSSTINNIGDNVETSPMWIIHHTHTQTQTHTGKQAVKQAGVRTRAHTQTNLYGSMLLCFHQQLFNEMQIKIIINLNSTIVLGMETCYYIYYQIAFGAIRKAMLENHFLLENYIQFSWFLVFGLGFIGPAA